MDLGKRLLTINEVLDLAQVSRFTLYRDSRNGKIEPIYFGKNVRYREQDAVKYAEEKNSSKLVNYYRNKENQDE